MSRNRRGRGLIIRSHVQYFALMWLVMGAFSAGFVWAAAGFLKQSTAVHQFLAAVGVSGFVVLSCLSFIARTPSRVIHWAMCLGFGAVPPFFLVLGTLAAGYFVLVPRTFAVHAMQWIAIAFVAAIWIAIDLRAFQRRVSESGYLEREFTEFDNHVAMRWCRGTDLERPPISDATVLGRVLKRHGSKVVVMIAPLVGAGYAASQLLNRFGGAEPVLLLVAMLTLPLFMAGLVKLFCGAYLNIYKVWQIERRTGKPVLFDAIPAE